MRNGCHGLETMIVRFEYRYPIGRRQIDGRHEVFMDGQDLSEVREPGSAFEFHGLQYCVSTMSCRNFAFTPGYVTGSRKTLRTSSTIYSSIVSTSLL